MTRGRGRPTLTTGQEANHPVVSTQARLGRDLVLFHYAHGDDESLGGDFVDQAQGWFDSLWGTVSAPLT